MKISDLIQSIIKLAESRLNIDPNTADSISVGINFDSNHMWQVWLERPTRAQVQLAAAQLAEMNRTNAYHNYQCDTYCWGTHENLLTALKQLELDVFNMNVTTTSYTTTKTIDVTESRTVPVL